MGKRRGSYLIDGQVPINYSNLQKVIKEKDGPSSLIDLDTLEGKSALDFAPSGFGLGVNALYLSAPDFNTILNGGFYRMDGGTNKPPGTHAWTYLLVIRHASTYVTQIGINYEDKAALCVRSFISPTWGAWQTVPRSDVNIIINAKFNCNTTNGRVIIPAGLDKYATS